MDRTGVEGNRDRLHAPTKVACGAGGVAGAGHVTVRGVAGAEHVPDDGPEHAHTAGRQDVAGLAHKLATRRLVQAAYCLQFRVADDCNKWRMWGGFL